MKIFYKFLSTILKPRIEKNTVIKKFISILSFHPGKTIDVILASYQVKAFLELKYHILTIICLFLGPFRATQIWNEIVDHLKTNVEVKRRRYKMKTYDNSFSGAHAVDVVMTYLLSEKNTFSTDLSRDKAVKVGIS